MILTHRPSINKEGLIRTDNKFGWTIPEPDNCMSQFIEFACKNNLHNLDIGAAYGVASLQVAEKGGLITAIDIDQQHLNIIKNSIIKDFEHNIQVQLLKFPQETNFPAKSIGGILLAHVIHFLDYNTLLTALEKMYDWLHPEGKIFVTVFSDRSQWLSNMSPIDWLNKDYPTTIYPKKIDMKIGRWLPDELLLFTPQKLQSLFKKFNFKIEECGYISRSKKQEEGIGIIVTK
ncbi:MAG: class I SAM-dependent methyltransferase [Phycisphaerales bacterium]|nr:class I SAM-dependent methyltransferase [Phycisphaerales bacterium]